MAQHDYVISNGTGAAVRSDINSALAAIVSQNSGATEPATTYAYQFWADTTTATLKLRNSANSAWIELMQLDGTLTMEDGTTALPGLAFRNDLDTGLWRPGANQLAISTNAVERVEFGATEVVFNDGGVDYDFRVEGDTNANLLFVDASTDRVGIGTSSPSQLLHIYQPLTNSQAYQIIENNRSRNAATQYKTTLGAWYTGVGIGADVNRFTIYEDGVGDRLVIDSSGRVGIGTTSPASTLSVGGNAPLAGAIGAVCSAGGIALSLTDNVNSSLHVRTANGGAIIGTDAGGVLRFATNGVATTDERARIDSSGRLLVGTSSARTNVDGYAPIFQAEVAGSSDASNRLMSFTYGRNSGSGGGVFAFNRHSSITVGGQGAVADGYNLGQIRFNGSDGTNFIGAAEVKAEVDGTPGANDMPGRLVFSTTADGASSPTERMRISQNGVVTVKNGAVAEIGTLTDAATITPNFAANCNFTVTLGGNRTLANPTNVTAGQSGSLFIVQDGTGSRTLSWGSNWDWTGGTAPTLTTTANAVDRVDYVCRSATSIQAVYTSNYS